MGTPPLTVRQIAKFLGIDENTVYRLVKRDESPGFEFAGSWRFERDHIDAGIEIQKATLR